LTAATYLECENDIPAVLLEERQGTKERVPVQGEHYKRSRNGTPLDEHDHLFAKQLISRGGNLQELSAGIGRWSWCAVTGCVPWSRKGSKAFRR